MTAEQHEELPELALGNIDALDGEDAVPLVANTALRDILRTLGRAPNPKDCLRECVLTLHQWTSADAASVYRADTEADLLLLLHSVGFPRELVLQTEQLPIAHSLTGLAVTQRQLIFCQNIDHDTRILAEYARLLGHSGFRTVIALPLITRDRIIGALTLGWQRHLHLAVADRDLLMSLGYGVALATERYLC